MNSLIKRVADAFGVRTEDITGRSSLHNVVLPRQVAMYLLWIEGYSHKEIIKAFNKKHTSLVSYSFGIIANRMVWDSSLKSKIKILQGEVNG